jgi:hypothetical protein
LSPSAPSRAARSGYALIETMYPELPKIELFARQGAAGLGGMGQ